MDVHAKADSNAKAILNSVSSHQTIGTRNPVIQGLANSTKNGQSDRSTTLISITTPKVPTPTSLMTGIKQRVSNIKPNNKQQISRTYQKPQVPMSMKTEIPEGLRVMCCTCSQLFNSQPELYNHKCGSVENNSGAMRSVLTNGRPTKTAEDSLIATVVQGQNSNQLSSSEDQDKFVLDLAAQLTQADQQSHGQMYQIQIQNPTSGSSSVGNSIIKPKNTYTRKKTIPKPKANNQLNQNHNNTVQANQESNQQTLLMSGDQLVMSSGQNQAQQEASGDDQMIMLQQPDGQYVQICVPFGVDVNEVIQSLYGGGDSTTLSADQVMVNQEGETIQMHQDEPMAMELATDLPSEQQPQHAQQVEATIQTADGEQVIYIPINEDGTYAIDAESLALLGGGDIAMMTSAST